MISAISRMEKIVQGRKIMVIRWETGFSVLALLNVAVR